MSHSKLYDRESLSKMVHLIYEYLQIKSKNPPRTIKDKPMHRKAVDSFIDSLPDNAGANFIWDFLTYQFYIYSTQIHERRPMPSWFMGKEAWNRWNNYDEGSRWHSREWVRENKLVNPILENKYKKVSQETLDKERLKMSRISGPNFCFMKYGEEVFTESDKICITCPFYKDCELLTENITGVSVLQEASASINKRSIEEDKQLSHSHIVVRNIIRNREYEEDM